MKTSIKKAYWKSKIFKDSKYSDIVTTVFYQSKDTFIDTDSKFLFEIICFHFFKKYPKATIKLKLKGSYGVMYPEAYRIYVYNKIYKKLTKKKIDNDIFKIKKSKELFYRVKLEFFSSSYQKMILEIIDILQIDFKKESDRFCKILFKTKNKKDFYIE